MATELRIDELMKTALEVEGMLSLAAGFTDNAVMPRTAVRDIVNELLADDSNNAILQYGVPEGRPRLREMIAEHVNRLEVECGASPDAAGADRMVITNGSQQALFMAIEALCSPGDVVLVEAPTYFVFLDLLRTLGVEAVSLPSIDDSLDVEALPAFFEELKRNGTLERVRATYIVSYFSNPSALSLSTKQKDGLLVQLEKYLPASTLIEDIAYREFYFEKAWPAPTTLSSGTTLRRVVTGTCTKNFSTGLKLGYAIVTDDALLRRILDLKRCHDFGTSHFVQAIVERAFERGDYARFLKHFRPIYGAKNASLDAALVEHGLKDLGWSWQSSHGSLYIWARAPGGITTGPDSALYRACLDEAVLYVPGALCYAGGGDDRVRLSFGALQADRLPEAAARFCRAARSAAAQIDA